MNARHLALGAALLIPATARSAPPMPIAIQDRIVASAPAPSWRDVPDDDLLVMDLGAKGHVTIELAPEFAPVHVANIRVLARAGWWNNAAIVRVQDDYVVQWSEVEENAKRPAGVDLHPPAEYERPLAGLAFRKLAYADPYAPQVGDADGWPVGTDGRHAWLAHCYGMVGVGRDMPPDTGDGTELYAVNGHGPRQLDRNIALVGRVVGGMPILSALPRGTGPLGFYQGPEPRIPILSIHLASELPPQARPAYQVMRTDTPDFAALVDARANRRDLFFVRPAGGVDVCNVPVPIRVAPGARG